MEIDRSIRVLSEMFQDQPWFFDVGLDEYKRLVVYINYTCHATLHDIPASVDGKDVVVHFASHYKASREKYTSPGYGKPKLVLDVEEDAEDEEVIFPNGIGFLIEELDRLEKVCGSNALQDIFYEVHDGSSAVTDVSSKYPDVRVSMARLYQQYGFDLIYEELDG